MSFLIEPIESSDVMLEPNPTRFEASVHNSLDGRTVRSLANCVCRLGVFFGAYKQNGLVTWPPACNKNFDSSILQI